MHAEPQRLYVHFLSYMSFSEAAEELRMPYFLQRFAHEHIQKIWHPNLFFDLSELQRYFFHLFMSSRKQPQVFHGNIF